MPQAFSTSLRTLIVCLSCAAATFGTATASASPAAGAVLGRRVIVGLSVLDLMSLRSLIVRWGLIVLVAAAWRIRVVITTRRLAAVIGTLDVITTLGLAAVVGTLEVVTTLRLAAVVGMLEVATVLAMLPAVGVLEVATILAMLPVVGVLEVLMVHRLRPGPVALDSPGTVSFPMLLSFPIVPVLLHIVVAHAFRAPGLAAPGVLVVFSPPIVVHFPIENRFVVIITPAPVIVSRAVPVPVPGTPPKAVEEKDVRLHVRGHVDISSGHDDHLGRRGKDDGRRQLNAHLDIQLRPGRYGPKAEP